MKTLTCSKRQRPDARSRAEGRGVARTVAPSKHDFDALLRKGKSLTLHPPGGQLHGRAGRRALLEDGERYLLRCIALRPKYVPPRILLMRNLLAQSRGREKEVPLLAMQALDETPIKHCERKTEHADEAVTIVQLGLHAMHKADRPQGRMDDFLEDAIKHVPQLELTLVEMVHHMRFNVHLPRVWEDEDAYDISD